MGQRDIEAFVGPARALFHVRSALCAAERVGEGQTLAAAAGIVKEQGQSSIYIASQLLAPKPQS